VPADEGLDPARLGAEGGEVGVGRRGEGRALGPRRQGGEGGEDLLALGRAQRVEGGATGGADLGEVAVVEQGERAAALAAGAGAQVVLNPYVPLSPVSLRRGPGPVRPSFHTRSLLGGVETVVVRCAMVPSLSHTRERRDILVHRPAGGGGAGDMRSCAALRFGERRDSHRGLARRPLPCRPEIFGAPRGAGGGTMTDATEAKDALEATPEPPAGFHPGGLREITRLELAPELRYLAARLLDVSAETWAERAHAAGCVCAALVEELASARADREPAEVLV